MDENNQHDGYLKDLPLWADDKRSFGVIVHA